MELSLHISIYLGRLKAYEGLVLLELAFWQHYVLYGCHNNADRLSPRATCGYSHVPVAYQRGERWWNEA